MKNIDEDKKNIIDSTSENQNIKGEEETSASKVMDEESTSCYYILGYN